MQINRKPALRITTRKIFSSDDSQDSINIQNEWLNKHQPTGKMSLLARRKLQCEFLINPIDTKRKNRKNSYETYHELLNEMKAKVSAKGRERCISYCHRDAEYIFVDHSSNSPHPKCKKELRIDSYLNSVGIFQLNFNVALNDYNL